METSMVMIFGILALLLRVGFAMQASGSLRSKNAAGAILRITADTAFSTLAFWAIGAAILLQLNNPYVGFDPHILFGQSSDVAQKEFFHLAIILIGGAIVAGALAERARFYVGIAASVLLSAIVIPVAGHWIWFGWLKNLGFVDVGGAAAIHLPAAIFAAVGAAFVGPRTGKYNKDGSSNSIPGHSLPLASVGVLLLLVGWLPYVLGSVMVHGGLTMFEGDALGVAAMNIMLAAAAGALAGMLYGQFRYGKPDIFFTYSGLLGAMVAITAGAANMGNIGALLTGAIVGLLVPLLTFEIDMRWHLDDPQGVVAIHGIGAVCGLLAAAVFAPIDFTQRIHLLLIQILGIVVVLILSAVFAIALFVPLKAAALLRVTEADEFDGLDLGEHDINAYPDFQQTTIKSYHLREA
jgi:ammonium transporter, Amt family